jgi:hypothetical protein
MIPWHGMAICHFHDGAASSHSCGGSAPGPVFLLARLVSPVVSLICQFQPRLPIAKLRLGGEEDKCANTLDSMRRDEVPQTLRYAHSSPIRKIKHAIKQIICSLL